MNILANESIFAKPLAASIFILIYFIIPLLLAAPLSHEAPARVVVLGIAQDGGIPQIGCTDKICRTQHHFISSLAIMTKESTYLIDATPDLRTQYAAWSKRFHAERKNLFDGIFLTHAHMGHYTGLMYLGKESISTRQVPVYCSREMADFLTKNAPWSLLVSNGNIELHPFEPNQAIRFAGFDITPLPVPHRKEFTDTHGFLIHGTSRSLLYIPDIDSWNPVREQITGWLQKSDYALLDGTFYSGDELPGRNIKLVPHPTIQDSIAFFSSLPPFRAQIFFTHLNHTNRALDPDSAEHKSLSKTRFKIAEEWHVFEL